MMTYPLSSCLMVRFPALGSETPGRTRAARALINEPHTQSIYDLQVPERGVLNQGFVESQVVRGPHT